MRIKEILALTPLRTRIFISLHMADYGNWKDGEYFGDVENLKKETNHIIEMMEEFLADGKPEGFAKYDLK